MMVGIPSFFYFQKNNGIVKKCEYCGKEFIGKGERKFCSNKCKFEHQHKINVDKYYEKLKEDAERLGANVHTQKDYENGGGAKIYLLK